MPLRLPRARRPRLLLLAGVSLLGGIATLVLLLAFSASADDYLAHGDRLAADYNFRGALTAYQEARRQEPNNPVVALRVARIHRAQRGFDAAEPELAVALASPVTRQAALLEAGDLALDRADPAAATAYWQAAARESPENPLPHSRLTGLAIGQGDFVSADDHLQAYLALQPNDPQARYQHLLTGAVTAPTTLSDRLAAIGSERPAKLSAKLAAIERGIHEAGRAASPAEADLWVGQALLEAGELPFARAVLERAWQADPGSMAIKNRLAYVLSQTGDPDPAVTLAAEVRDAEPDNDLAWLTLGLAQRAGGQLNAARETFQTAEGRFPDDPIFPAELGNTLLALGQGTDAEVKFNRAVSLAPDEATFQRLKAKFYLDRGWQIDEGLRAAWRAEALRPDDAEIKDLVAWGHYLSGDIEVANKKSLEALRLDPTLASAHYHRAVMAEATGVYDLARLEYEKARDLARDGATRDAATEALSHLPLTP